MWWVMLVLAQALHGVTFGVFWLAVVRLVNGITPRDLSLGSSLSTAVGGVGAVAGMYGAGWMVERYSNRLLCGIY